MKDLVNQSSHKALKWAEILRQNGFEFPFGKEQINIRCPFHDDQHPSLGINLRKGLWYCRTGCGSGKLEDFLSRFLGKKFDLPEIFNDDLFILGEFDEKKDEKELRETKIPFSTGPIPEWIYDRGFSDEQLKKWGCRKTEEGSLFIPILDNGERLVGWVCRREKGKEPKYVYSKGLQTSKLLFGQYNTLGQTLEFLCITEGPLDTIWLVQHDFSSVALFGVNLSPRQEQLLSQIKTSEVVLCLDRDEPGRRAIQKIAPRLEKRFVVSYIDIPEDCKDVQDIRDQNKLKQVIKNRKLFGGL